jgi:hypothetical protein
MCGIGGWRWSSTFNMAVIMLLDVCGNATAHRPGQLRSQNTLFSHSNRKKTERLGVI